MTILRILQTKCWWCNSLHSYSNHVLFSNAVIYSIPSDTKVSMTDLISLSSLKFLELALKAQVWASTGPDHLHSSQCLLPAQSCHRHDVSYYQSDTAGHTCQTVKREGWIKSMMKLKFQKTWLACNYYAGLRNADKPFLRKLNSMSILGNTNQTTDCDSRTKKKMQELCGKIRGSEV